VGRLDSKTLTGSTKKSTGLSTRAWRGPHFTNQQSPRVPPDVWWRCDTSNENKPIILRHCCYCYEAARSLYLLHGPEVGEEDKQTTNVIIFRLECGRRKKALRQHRCEVQPLHTFLWHNGSCIQLLAFVFTFRTALNTETCWNTHRSRCSRNDVRTSYRSCLGARTQAEVSTAPVKSSRYTPHKLTSRLRCIKTVYFSKDIERFWIPYRYKRQYQYQIVSFVALQILIFKY